VPGLEKATLVLANTKERKKERERAYKKYLNVLLIIEIFFNQIDYSYSS